MNPEDHVQFDYNQITDNIYIGTNSCCSMHFEEDLLKKGILADISLESERLDQPWGVKHFLWLPTVDHTPPSIDSLVLGTQMLAYCEERNLQVYVHCKNGHGRAPTLVAAYFISTGLSLKKAIKKIRDKRREIHIEPVQEATLKMFAERVKW